MPTPNVPLLRQVLAHIEDHPDEWRQAEWAMRTHCGTAYCFAGHAVRFGRPDAEFIFDGTRAANVQLPGNLMPTTIELLAADLLGLDWSDASELFLAGNSLDHLRLLVDEICEPAEDQEVIDA